MTDIKLGGAGDASTIVTQGLADHLLRAGPGTGPVRVLVTLCDSDVAPEAEDLFAARPTFAVQPKAPRLYEVRLLPEEVPDLERRTDLFERLGSGTALFGKQALDPEATVTIDVAGDALVADAITEAGGRPGRKGFGVTRATLPAARLAALIADPRVEAIEVSKVEG